LFSILKINFIQKPPFQIEKKRYVSFAIFSVVDFFNETMTRYISQGNAGVGNKPK